MRYLTILMAVIVVGTAFANPVPDDVVQDFRNLVAETARQGRCPDPARLATHFTRHGVDLLGGALVDTVTAHLDLFAPIMAAGQRAGYRPNERLQSYLRQHADAGERQVMVDALRDWLVAPDISYRKIVGVDMVIFPPEASATVVTLRVQAAELLADWQDGASLPAVTALAESDTLSSAARARLRTVQGRLAAARQSPSWSFVAETVILQIDDPTAFTVHGEYHFRHNVPGVPLAIAYPFPNEDTLGPPQLIAASVDVSQDDGLWRWRLEDAAKDDVVRIDYRQAMNGRIAHYVLTSALGWTEPIERATLEVRVPAGLKVRVPLLSVAERTADEVIYRATFENWFPTEELIVYLD